MSDKNELVGLDVDRERSVTATFADGRVAVFLLADLRSGCPCATCRDLRDRGELAWPRPDSPVPLSVASAEFHGAWGINFQWNDGHSTGIYPFDLLRRWSDED